jgi:hypothetical protein
MGEDRERIKNMVNWAVDEMKKLYDRVKDVSITAAGFIRRRATELSPSLGSAMRKEGLSHGTTT